MGFVEEVFAPVNAAPRPMSLQPAMPAAAPLLPRILTPLNLLSIALLFAEGLLSRSREARYVLVALALALVPLVLPVWSRQVWNRLQLMGGIPLATALGVLVGVLRDARRKPIAALALAGLVASSGLFVTQTIRPNIPPQAYTELKEAIAMLDESLGHNNYCLVARNIKVLYWLETITDNVHRHPSECTVQTIFIDVLRAPPSGSEVVSRGRYVAAWTPAKLHPALPPAEH